MRKLYQLCLFFIFLSPGMLAQKVLPQVYTIEGDYTEFTISIPATT